MLTLLRISGFGLIDALELPLGRGLTVITGETGAGKSILVDALSLLRGGRASAEVVRSGQAEARVEAVFEFPADDARVVALCEQGRAETDEAGAAQVIVRRVIAAGGRGRVYLGASLATAAELAAAVGSWVDITSQHDQQSLMDPQSQLDIVDAFADNQEILGEMAGAHAGWVEAREALAALDVDARARAEREDFLRYQVRELSDADLQPGEDEDLKRERALLRDGEKIAAAVTLAEDALYAGENAAAERIATVMTALGPLASLADGLSSAVERLGEARVLVEDAARELARFGERFKGGYDPARLAEVEDRLFLVTRLLRKHGGSIESARAERDRLETELASLGNFEQALRDKQDAAAAAETRARAVADQLSLRRTRAARALGPKIDETLHELGLGGARLSITIEADEAAAGPTARGRDRVRFLFAPNQGEVERPLARIASGGELSRVMLAVKRALLHAETAVLTVFDEVDAGVSGAVAEVIARKLKAIAESRQVFVVTHMPQIAAFADHHLHVEKAVRGGRTVVAVTALGETGRRDELARMLAGERPSKEALAHADEMRRRAVTPAPKKRQRG